MTLTTLPFSFCAAVGLAWGSCKRPRGDPDINADITLCGLAFQAWAHRLCCSILAGVDIASPHLMSRQIPLAVAPQTRRGIDVIILQFPVPGRVGSHL